MKNLPNKAKLDSKDLERLADAIEQKLDQADCNVISGQMLRADRVQFAGGESRLRPYMQWAAILFLLAALGLSIPFLLRYFGKETPVQKLITLNVPKGSIGRIELSDGSRIVINANSRFSYPAQFSGNSREVNLQGEAYFEVAHNAAKPFFIHSGRLLTRVTGTSFDIRAYEGSRLAEVTVRTGHVLVSLNGMKNTIGLKSAVLSLSPDQKASLNTESGLFQSARADAGHSIAWRDGKLVFDAVPLSDVLERISDHYNVALTAGTVSAGSRLVTAEFDREPLADVLKVLSIISHVNCRVENNEITISEPAFNQTKGNI